MWRGLIPFYYRTFEEDKTEAVIDKRYAIALFLIFFSLSQINSEALDVFDLKPAGADAYNPAEVLKLTPGTPIVITIGKQNLPAARGVGVVRWFFKIYVNSLLGSITETAFFQERTAGDSWDFYREIPFQIPLPAEEGQYRIEIYLEDLIGGRFFADSRSFFVFYREKSDPERPLTEEPASEEESFYSFRMDNIKVEVLETQRTGTRLEIVVLIGNNGPRTWVGIFDAAFGDTQGNYFRALKEGIIRADGFGGVDLTEGASREIRIYFDTKPFEPENIMFLEIFFRGKERGKIEQIPVPWKKQS